MTTGLIQRELLAEPAWDVARLFPAQGQWSELEYLTLRGNHLVEFADGKVEVLRMPGQRHQRVVALLFQLIAAFVAVGRRGEVLMAPLPVRLWPGKYREPDLVFMAAAHRQRQHEQYWDGADLVIEVVSPDDPERDWVVKRQEYARAGIPEYWLVDRRSRMITILCLGNDGYELHGNFGAGQQATSVVLAGFAVDVAAIFAAAEAA